MEEHQLHGSVPSSHHYHHHHHHHIKKHRIPSNKDEREEEELDPRIQVELERLNKASEEINKLELELDDARAGFRQVLSDSTQCLNGLAKKLGNCVYKARPYYDSRMKLKESHVESQKAALRFERACSMHEAAKEMVQLAEEGYKRREEDLDPTWQEMLNHATMKVNEAEKERIESESNHQQTTINFKKREEDVQKLQKDLKRSITKSRPYFEMKAKFNQVMEEQKGIVSRLEDNVSQAKALYSQALRNLEAISDNIHRTRLERRQNRELGERGAGVGAEAPSPPPSWDKGMNIEGSASSCAFGSDTEDDPAQCSNQKKTDRGIVRHEAAHRNRSSVSEALIEADSLEPDPLNVVMFRTDSPQSSSPQRNPANFLPPSVINPDPDRARSASYRAAVDKSKDEEMNVGADAGDVEESHDITPTPEGIGNFSSLAISPPLLEPVQISLDHRDPYAHSSSNSNPQCSPGSDLSVRQSSLSRAQEWVNRSPVPQQRRFVKSKSLINASAASSSLGSLASPPGDDNKEEEGEEKPLSSSLTTAALKAMREGQGIPEKENINTSPREGPSARSQTSHVYTRLHSAPVPTSHVSQPLKSSSLGSAGSVRSLSSTPPEDHASGNSPSSHRKSPKLQGLILRVDPSGGGSSNLMKPASSVGAVIGTSQHSHTSQSAPPQSVSSSSVPRVVISTQHPTLGVFTEQAEQQTPSTSSQPNPVSPSAAANTTSGTSPPKSSPDSFSSPTLQLSTSTSPSSIPKPSPTAPRHPTSLITQQINKVMHAVAEASASVSSSSPFKVSAYNSKTAPATLMGNSYRLSSTTAVSPRSHHHPQVSPMGNPQTLMSPTATERSIAVTPGGRSDSLSTIGSGSIHSRNIHLKPPSDSSDTESIASTGPMLDDDQVELINMDFTEQSIANPEDTDCPEDYDYPPIDPNLANPRGHWSRMSLPPRLNYLEGFLERARKLSGDKRSPGDSQSTELGADIEGEGVSCSDAQSEGILCEEGYHGSGSQYVDNLEINDSQVENSQVLVGGEALGISEARPTTEYVAGNQETFGSYTIRECNSLGKGVCAKVEATVVISPDEGISVIEASNDFTEHEEDVTESEELVTEENHYL